jgi:hypothetical protein
MKNTIEIRSEGVNVYAELGVKASAVGKVIVIVMLVFVIVAISLLLSTVKEEDIGSVLIPVFLIGSLLIAFPVRFLIWNMFGKEILIITTKSISYQYDYGILKTNLKTISYDKLGTGFDKFKSHEGIMKGYLIFYNYNKETNIPEPIHETTVLVECEKIELLDAAIDKIFVNEFHDKNGFIFTSPN